MPAQTLCQDRFKPPFYGGPSTLAGMGPLRDVWMGMRDTTFVVAQVVTLGVVAMVLGLVALNAALGRPAPAPQPTPATGPSRPLIALVPTIMAATPTAAASSPTATLFVPPGFAQATATAGRGEPASAVEPTRAAAAPSPPTATPRPPEPTAAPQPSPTPAAVASPTARPSANPTGQLMKVLPAADGLPARVRAEPNTKSPILLRVPLGSTVEVIGQATGEQLQAGNTKWLRVRWKEQTGWVYSSLLGE